MQHRINTTRKSQSQTLANRYARVASGTRLVIAAHSGYHVSCLIEIDRCSSQPFQDKDIFGHVSVETYWYNRYIEKNVEHAKLDEILGVMRAVRDDVECNTQLLQEQQAMQSIFV